jgi:hypothetical protein
MNVICLYEEYSTGEPGYVHYAVAIITMNASVTDVRSL